MPWETFITNNSPASVLKPGDYSEPDPKTVVATAGGTELIAADATKKLRFANISIEAKAKANGNPVIVYVGQGTVPTAASHSYKWLAGHEEKDFELNGQELIALAETGTILIQVQTADAVVVN